MKVKDLFEEELYFVWVENKAGNTYAKYEPNENVHQIINDIQGNHLKLNRIYVRQVINGFCNPFYEVVFEVSWSTK